MRFVQLLWITTRPGRAWVGSVTNKHNPSTKSGLDACISQTISMVIHVKNDHQINYNCFNEPFAVSPYRSLYWDMHGLIFETSIWLLAGSTRFVDATMSCKELRSPQAAASFGDIKPMTRRYNASQVTQESTILENIKQCNENNACEPQATLSKVTLLENIQAVQWEHSAREPHAK